MLYIPGNCDSFAEGNCSFMATMGVWGHNVTSYIVNKGRRLPLLCEILASLEILQYFFYFPLYGSYFYDAYMFLK